MLLCGFSDDLSDYLAMRSDGQRLKAPRHKIASGDGASKVLRPILLRRERISTAGSTRSEFALPRVSRAGCTAGIKV
jgi:hypothetical protein